MVENSRASVHWMAEKWMKCLDEISYKFLKRWQLWLESNVSAFKTLK